MVNSLASVVVQKGFYPPFSVNGYSSFSSLFSSELFHNVKVKWGMSKKKGARKQVSVITSAMENMYIQEESSTIYENDGNMYAAH